jgi:Trk K+ transport system NAD-binding subunit
LLLLREFAWPLFFFTLAMIGGGFLYHALAQRAGVASGGRVAAIYQVLTLTFLQPTGEFPSVWYLQLFYFLMPVIGISILAQGLADFGVLFFNRRARGKEWDMALASTFRDHVVVVGLGHLGFRIISHLVETEQEIVAIELQQESELVTRAKRLDVPVLIGNGKDDEMLAAAGVAHARAILVCTQNDSLNLQIALKVRRLNPTIRVVLRIFDDEFARTLHDLFGFQAMSATSMAAPAFAAAGSGVDLTRPITVEGESLTLACFDLGPRSRLAGLSVSAIEQDYDVSVVLVRQNQTSDFHPAGERRLSPDDVLAVLGGVEQIGHLVKDNR